MWHSEQGRQCAALLFAGLAVFGTGCVETALRAEEREHDYDEIPQPAQAAPQDGSVWRGATASGSFLFFDRKARGVGDLVTVLVVENVSAAGSANTQLEKSSKLDASVSSDIGITDALQGAAHWFFRVIGVSSPGVPVAAGNTVNVIDSQMSNEFEGDGKTARKGSFNAIVTCRVVNALPGDVFHVRGRRSIVVNHELQLLTVEGLVRREDLGINNTVMSSSLAEAKLTFDGMGVIDEKQRPGLGARAIDWLYPF